MLGLQAGRALTGHDRRNDSSRAVTLSPKAARFVDAALGDVLESTQGMAVILQALMFAMLKSVDTAARRPMDEDALSDVTNDVRYLRAIHDDVRSQLLRRRRRGLGRDDAAVVKAMLRHGLRQSDIAAFFGVNGGRISEINTGRRFADVEPSPSAEDILEVLGRL